MFSGMAVEGKRFIQTSESMPTRAAADRPAFGRMPAGAELPSGF